MRHANRYYSVRESQKRAGWYKVVLTGSFWGYVDLDLPLYETFDEALYVAQALEKIRREQNK